MYRLCHVIDNCIRVRKLHKSIIGLYTNRVYQVNIGQFSITSQGKNIYSFYMFPISIAFFLFPIYHFSLLSAPIPPLSLFLSHHLSLFLPLSLSLSLSLYFIQDNCHAYFYSSFNALILQSITLLLTLALPPPLRLHPSPLHWELFLWLTWLASHAAYELCAPHSPSSA